MKHLIYSNSYYTCNNASHRHTGRASKQFICAAATRRIMGPEPPPSRTNRSKPEWVRILEEDAAVDEDVAQLLEGTDSDPDMIRAKMQQKLAEPLSKPEVPFEARTGSDEAPRITFRDVDVFDMWVWIEMLVPPSERERELLQSTVRSWFVVGKLGGYNSGNLQVYYNNSDDNSYMDYDNSELGGSYRSYMHSCSDVEFKGSWARFHLDMGTADELAFDVLLNMLVGFSAEVAGMSQIIMGGEHERWAIPEADEDNMFDDSRKVEHGEAPRVGMNPMKLPQGLEEELELLDQLGEVYSSQPDKPGQPERGLRPVNPWQPIQAGAGSSSSSRNMSSRRSSAGSQGSGSSNSSSSSRGRASRLRDLQKLDAPGMTLYSPDEFKQEYNVADDDVQ